MGDAEESKHGKDPLWAFPIAALVAFGFVGLAIAVGPGGFFVEPIGPVRVILGGVISLIGVGLIIGGAGTRNAVTFGGGCFMLGLGLAEMLGVPHCVDCGGI